MRKLYDFFRKGSTQALIMLALLLQFPLWQIARGDGKTELKRNTPFWDTHQVSQRMSQSQLTDLFKKEANTSGNTWNSTWLNAAAEKPSLERDRIEWFETFEGNDFPPAGWSIYSNAATSPNWVASTQNNHTPTGSKSAFHNYGSAGVNLENWLITPSLSIPQSNLIVLKFWSFNIDPSYYESNSVWISTTNNNPASGSFSQIWTTPTVQASWVETTIDLTSYAGSTIYLAFRYQGIYAHGWFVDDVLVSSNIDPSPIIIVSPTSIARNLPQGQSATRLITVGNLGMETLNYSASITYGSGASGWLSLNPSTGNVAGGQSAQITATFNASGLAQGTYEAQIAINSNAPANPQVLVNATLNVVPPSSSELTVIADFYFFPTGISDDGTKVSIAPFGGGGGLYWSAQGGLSPLPNNTLSAYGISNSGLIVGTFSNPDLLYNGQPVETAGRWDPVTNTWSFLGMNPAVPQPNFSNYNDGWGISADGNTVVGMQWYSGSSVRAFKWTTAGGYDNNVGNAHQMNNRPNGVNRSGNVIFGWAQTAMASRSPAIWNNGELILPASSLYGEATCASPSGNFVAGNVGSQGFIWSPANGITTFDNTLNAGNISCLTMLDDGTIFGYIVEGWPPFIDNRRAFVRHPDGQMEFFNDYAMTRGFADAAEWTFFSINAVTPNGNNFVGAGNSPENQFQTFVLSFGSTTGNPNIAVNPTSITKTMQPGQTGTQALTISNSGAAPLNYTLTVTTNSRGTSAVETPREGYSLPMGSDRMNPTDAATPAEPVIKPLDTPIYRNMTQGFEDITLLPGLGWALTNNSSPLGTTGWFQGNPTVFPAQAGPETSYIGANYNNTGSVGTISNWLITPVLELQNGATVTFWTRTPTNSTWADRLELRLSTAGNSTNVGSTATSVGDFTTLLLSVNPNLTGTGYPQVWTEFTATIQGLTGTVNGRLAFRYFVTDGGANGNNSNFVGIDSFVYTGQGGGGGNTWLTATPLTGTVPAGGSAQVEVGFNSNNLALGTYTGNINIASNATNQPSLDVPVTLNVAGPSGGLPFEEDFASGSFATNGWTFDPAQGNWRILTTAGNPAPSAEFYWSPSATNYSFALVSKNLDATANTTVVLSFDVFLDNYATTTVEELKVYVWNGTAWVLIDTFSNQGDDFPWTSKTYNISTHAAGKVTKVKFEASGANSFNLNWWRLDNIKVFQPAAVDLAALAVVGNVTPSVGTATTYNVQVKNNGGSTQSNYTVKLRVNGTEVASVAGPAIAPTQTLNVPLNWTPAAQGPVVLTGEVIVAGDENPANNITPPFNVVVQPQGLVAITIGAQTTLPTYRIPFDFYWKNSLSQTIFYPEEMNNMAGAITGINLFNNFATDLPNKAVKIWMGTTNLPNLADGWVDPSTLTLVFDGTVNFPLGANTIFVPFNQPFIYTGGNLVLYTFRVWEDQYFNSNDKFYVTETPNKPNRTRHVQADATQYDPANPPAPAAAQLKSAHPDITLFFNTAGLGALQGVVSNNAGGPVEGVKVQIVGTSSIAYTNAQGQYSFPYVLAGQINVEFSKLGFVTQTLPATITADQTTTLNVTLQAMPQVTVSGFVAGNDAPTVGLSGAAVVLEGYQNYNVTTGANGQFSIPGVYANNTYTIKVTKEGYQPYQGTVVVGGSNVTVPNIILTEIILSPKNLTATISPTNPNLVNLQWNMLQDVEFRYDDGVSTGQLGFQSGTTSGVIGAKHTQSASLTELSWYLTSEGGPHPSIVIRIFGLTAQGLPNSQNVLYEATVTNVDNQWNTHTLPQPVTATGGFFMGVAYAGFVGIATDDGVGAPWVFQDNTHYYNSNFTTGTWSTFESLGTDFRRNTLLRAKGVPGAVNSYAIEPPIIGGEAMSYIPGKKVETGEPAWSTDQSKGLQYFKVYRNGQLLASNITQMQYSYTEMQLGQKCYHVTAVYGSGESAPSNTACVNILVGVNEQLEASTQLFPNPATETFSIRSLPMQRITITNALGVVVSDALLSGETTLKVNTSDWKAGVYLVQIHTSNGTITKRMVVVR